MNVLVAVSILLQHRILAIVTEIVVLNHVLRSLLLFPESTLAMDFILPMMVFSLDIGKIMSAVVREVEAGVVVHQHTQPRLMFVSGQMIADWLLIDSS